jgi:hypothetical protein
MLSNINPVLIHLIEAIIGYIALSTAIRVSIPKFQASS